VSLASFTKALGKIRIEEKSNQGTRATKET
jgi:hypothetical protein